LSRLTLLLAVEQLALLREEKISPLELAEEHIQEIKRRNPQLNAIVNFSDVDAERIRTQARTLMTASGPRGPLYGLPVTSSLPSQRPDCRAKWAGPPRDCRLASR
jgi:Asp-tRNA(Asn)/Glu-tRNA(Gln) amidotransferase A subunit family amidase